MTQRCPRMVDTGYLIWLTGRPCCVCEKTGGVDAAHVRYASQAFGKRSTGMQEKPDDKWAVPLCRECHTRQHSMNEQAFWALNLVHPLRLAEKLYRDYGGTGGQSKKSKPLTKQILHVR